ncbi:MAG: tetratricopeptide repeat protein, partial [Deltaproteobacteria bacterium]|nr:tetratricopeptide repeat protein [Deltaproteobacteria bacterium]
MARKVDGIRLGLHPDHTRLVVDLDGPFTYRLAEAAGDRAVVYFKGADLAPGWPASQRGLGRVARIKATDEEGRVKLEIFLTGPSQIQPLTWKGANRLVLDISPRPESGFEKPKPGPKGAAKPKTKSTAVAEAAPQNVPKTIRDTLNFLLTGQKIIMPQLQFSAEPETLLPGQVRGQTPFLARIERRAPGVEAVPTTLGLTASIRPILEVVGGPVMEEAVPGPIWTEKIPDMAAQARAMALETKGELEANLALAKEITAEGLEFFKGGNYQEALSQFQRVEPLAPNTELANEVLFYQADCLYQLHRQTGLPSFDQVENAYQKALGVSLQAPDASRALLRMGLLNFTSGNPDKAQGYFTLVLWEYPQAPEAVTAKVYLGRILLDEQKIQESVRLFREVILDHPSSPDVKMALWYLGRVLFEVGRYVEADGHLSELVKRWPDFYLEEPSILYYQGETAFRLDRLEEARRYLYRVINIQPQISNQDLILAR